MSAPSQHPNSPQARIDAIVRAFYNGCIVSEAEVKPLIEEWGDDLTYLSAGITIENVRPSLADEELQGSERRELDDISDADRLAYARHLIFTEAHDYDAAVTPIFKGATLRASTGRQAVVIFATMGNTDPETIYYGIFPDYQSFAKHAKDEGYILTESIHRPVDTEEWIEDADILASWGE